MFGESRPYDQENLDAATKWVEAIEADMGGTEGARPDADALGAQPPDEARGHPDHRRRGPATRRR